jgi:hypothetical protein
MKAAAFLISAMPDSIVINVMAAGPSNTDWPNQPKAHLMVAYLKESFKVTMTLSITTVQKIQEELRSVNANSDGVYVLGAK